MSRYIDLQEFEERIKKYIKPETLEEKALLEWCKDECIRQAYCMPTTDVVEVRHGAWMSAYEYALKIGCTDERRLEEAKADKRWKFCPFCEQQVKWDFNYCPNCGAKMDEEREEGKK